MGQTYTSAQCDALLAKDLERFEKCINDLIDPPLNQTQFDTCFVELQCRRWCGPDVDASRRLNAGEDVNTVISEELPRWCNGANGPLEGMKRRAAEVKRRLRVFSLNADWTFQWFAFHPCVGPLK